MTDRPTTQGNSTSSVLGRRLGGELIRLRTAAGKTQPQAAKVLSASTAKVAKMERGWVPIRDPDIRSLCELYGVTDRDRLASLLELARIDRERRKARGWWNDIPLSHTMAEYIPLESAATAIRTWQLSFIPGLLQTPGYARLQRRIFQPDEESESVEQFVATRMQRQARLTDSPELTLWSVIPEAALRYLACEAGVLRDQVVHLIRTADLPNVTVQVLPFTVGPLDSLTASFNVLSFAEPGSMDVIFAEHQFATMWLEGGEQAEQHVGLFADIAQRALNPEQSRSFLRTLLKDL